MSTVATKLAALPIAHNGHRTKTVAKAESKSESRLQRMGAILRHGELRITPAMAHEEETTQYAQRWPAPAIAALIVSAGGVLLSTILTLALFVFMFYANSNKDGNTQHEAELREIAANTTKIAVQEGKLETLERENTDLKLDVKTLQNDLKVVRMAQGLEVKGN